MTPMTDVIRLMARAAAGVNGGDPDTEYDGAPIWERHVDLVRAALTAAEAAGYVLVPKEPTEEMLQAAFDVRHKFDRIGIALAAARERTDYKMKMRWRAAVRAAPRWEP